LAHTCAEMISLTAGAQRGTAPDSNLIGLHLPPTATGRPSAKRDTTRGSRATALVFVNFLSLLFLSLNVKSNRFQTQLQCRVSAVQTIGQREKISEPTIVCPPATENGTFLPSLSSSAAV